MIVRISTEGQFRLDSAHFDELNRMDNEIVDRVARGDKEGFERLFQQMLSFVRQQGTRVPAEELVESDVILPPPDITMEEARHLFHGHGLVPG